MKLTILDIAKLSGYGKSTVSRVLNNDPHVSEKAKEKILAVLKQHNFIPNRAAQALKDRKSKVIGIIVTRLDSPSENRVVRGMLSVLNENSYDHLILESQFKVEKVEEHLNTLQTRQVAGVVIFNFSQLKPEQLIGWEDKTILISQQFANFNAVTYDNHEAIRLVMDYLHLQQKFNHISYLGVEESDLTTGLQRYQAYKNYCCQQQIEEKSILGDLSYYSGYNLAAKIITAKTQAIVCATDNLALGVNRYLEEQNLLDKIQVCGIGNNNLLKFLYPKTITVEFGLFRSGENAINRLLTVIADPQQEPSLIKSVPNLKIPANS